MKRDYCVSASIIRRPAELRKLPYPLQRKIRKFARIVDMSSSEKRAGKKAVDVLFPAMGVTSRMPDNAMYYDFGRVDDPFRFFSILDRILAYPYHSRMARKHPGKKEDSSWVGGTCRMYAWSRRKTKEDRGAAAIAYRCPPTGIVHTFVRGHEEAHAAMDLPWAMEGLQKGLKGELGIDLTAIGEGLPTEVVAHLAGLMACFRRGWNMHKILPKLVRMDVKGKKWLDTALTYLLRAQGVIEDDIYARLPTPSA